MKLPAHVLTKLCLAGAAGAVIVAIGCEHATPRVTEQRAEAVIVETTIETATEMPTMETFRYSQPPPGAAPRFDPPPPTPIRIPVKLVPIKKKTPQPIVRAHVCGPCGMG